MKIGIFVCVTVVMVLKKQATNELEKNQKIVILLEALFTFRVHHR